jgi:predicted methyltransferase MtxX (methanogen marker protein 4)
VRAIGPSLAPFGITDALANPTLEIRDAGNVLVASNNDWKTTQVGGIITGDQVAEITASTVAPTNDLESAIIASLAPGSYTAVVRGVGSATGTAVVDAFDLSAASAARLANIATRGLIQPADKLMISGFIIQNGPVRAVVRAIGPSLAAFGITNALPDTTLQLRNQNGTIVRENDDWKTTQQQDLEATGLQPTNDLEAALVETLQPGQYTAQVRGKPEATGTGVVQIYFLQ